MSGSLSINYTSVGPVNPNIVLSHSLTNQRSLVASVSTFDSQTTGYNVLIWGDVDKTVNPDIQTQQSNIANPTVAATLSQSGTGSGLSAVAYFFKYTITDGYAETLPSPESTITLSAAGANIVAALPNLPAGRNLSYNCYLSTVSGSETRQGNTTGTSYTQSAALVAGVALPTTNTLIGSTWVPYQQEIPVTISTGDGAKNIYLSIQDENGNVSTPVSATVTLDTALPVVTISNQSSSTLEDNSASNNITFSFSSNVEFQQYYVQVVPTSTSAYGTGSQIQQVYGSVNMHGNSASGFPANTAINCSINTIDLNIASNSSGSKNIKVFVQDFAGNWSI